MRVCHVIEAGAAGAGNVVLDLVRDGVAAGDDVTVVYGTSRTWPRFLEVLAGSGKVRLIPSPMRRAVGFHDVGDCFRLYGALRRNAPFDILHAHSSKAGALVRLLRLFFPNSRVVYTPHAFVTMAPGASPVYGYAETFLSVLCDAIICVSEQEKRHARRQLKIPEEKLHVIVNGIDLNEVSDRSAARRRLGAKDEDYIIGFIGRLEAQKNPLLALKAFAEAAANRPALRLAIVGEGAMQPDMERFLAARELGGRAGFMPAHNARSLVAGFDCLLCSSDYESFGLVIVEALAAGVPVVTVPVGIAAEAVISGKTGVLAEDHSAHALAAGIGKLADADTTLRMQMAAASKAMAQNFSLERMGRNTRALYAKLLEPKA